MRRRPQQACHHAVGCRIETAAATHDGHHQRQLSGVIENRRGQRMDARHRAAQCLVQGQCANLPQALGVVMAQAAVWVADAVEE